MLSKYAVLALGITVGVSSLVPSPADGQRRATTQGAVSGAVPRLYVEGEGGVSVPVGQLSKLTSSGPAFGLQLGYRLNNRVALTANGDFEWFNGTSVGSRNAPDMRLNYYTAGFEANVLNPRVNQWRLLADLGLGLSNFRTDRFGIPGGTPNTEFDHTYVATQGGLKLNYLPSRRVAMFVSARTRLTFADKTDTEMIANINPGRLQPFASAITVPLTLGLNVGI